MNKSICRFPIRTKIECKSLSNCDYWFCKEKKKCLEFELENRSIKKIHSQVQLVKIIEREKKSLTPAVRRIKFIPDKKIGDVNYYFCHYCGGLFDLKGITKDHVVPKSKGGKDGLKNLVPACVPCNREKGNIDYIDYIQYRYRSGKSLSKDAVKNFEYRKIINKN